MNKGVVFNNTTYELGNLVADVDSGIIALPDLQRPFVWKDTQVRDLIDSLYKGMPTGLIILWKIGDGDGYKPKAIGKDKVTTPNRLVIDGQQRLTSLFAVFTGKKVLNKNYTWRTPNIAFNPITEEIQVLNSSMEKDPEWINNITEIFNTGLFTLVKEYHEKIQEKKPDREFNEEEIGGRLERMKNIQKYSISVLELSSDLDPEEVSEILFDKIPDVVQVKAIFVHVDQRDAQHHHIPNQKDNADHHRHRGHGTFLRAASQYAKDQTCQRQRQGNGREETGQGG